VIVVGKTALVDVVLNVSLTAIVVFEVMLSWIEEATLAMIVLSIEDVVEIALTFTVDDEIVEVTNLVVFGVAMTVVL